MFRSIKYTAIISLFLIQTNFSQTAGWQVFTQSDNGLQYNYVSAIASIQNDIWIGYHKNEGVTKYNGSSWMTYDEDNSGYEEWPVDDISIDPEGRIWIGTYMGIFCNDNGQWQRFDTTNTPFPTNIIERVYCASDNSVWVSFLGNLMDYTNNFGLAHYDGQNWEFIDTRPIMDDPSYNTIFDITEDSEGNIWVCGSGIGLAKYTGSGWERYNDYYMYEYSRAFQFDNLDNVVISTDSDLLYYNFNEPVYLAYNEDFTNHVSSIQYDRSGNLVVMGYKYVAVNVDDQWFSYEIEAETGLKDATDLAIDDENRIWIATKEGLCSFNNNLTSVETTNDLPADFQLYQNYPNPFNATTVITYTIPEVSEISLKVYDALGCEIAVLVNNMQGPGSHSISFDASGLASGIYFARLSISSKQNISRKMILLK